MYQKCYFVISIDYLIKYRLLEQCVARNNNVWTRTPTAQETHFLTSMHCISYALDFELSFTSFCIRESPINQVNNPDSVV